MLERLAVSALTREGRYAAFHLAATNFIPGEGPGVFLARSSVSLPDTAHDDCADKRELGSNPVQGGRRDQNHIWDVFDTSTENGLRAGTAPTGLVSLIDVLDVASRFGQSGSSAIDPLSDATALAYHTRFDRGGPMPQGDRWDLQAPHGAIGLGDILDVAAQFGLTCA